MKNHILAIGLLLCGMTPALALDVGDISSFMNSDSSTLSKEIKIRPTVVASLTSIWNASPHR